MNTKEDSLYIKRLKERLRQRSDSKVFLSLAEELRKMERIEDAITVLIDGIKKNPDFVAARLTLGRWYLLSDMLPEAEKEFLEIIKRSPDNIFARRGLEEVCRRLGKPLDTKETASPKNRRLFGGHYVEAIQVPDTDVKANASVDRESVVKRLNSFLEAVKLHFSPELVTFSSVVNNKELVLSRLNRFLDAVKMHFNPQGSP